MQCDRLGTWTRTASRTLTIAAILTLSVIGNRAAADTFGSGGNAFEIEFVTIGDPGNPADTTGDPNTAGSVDYVYRIGKNEISLEMIEKAAAQGSESALFNYTWLSPDLDKGPHQPQLTGWFGAAKFVNWLNSSSGHPAAYQLKPNEVSELGESSVIIELWQLGDAGYDAANPFRNSLAHYFLPSVDEWYKAAYYDPRSGVYFDFPTGSDIPPTPVASGTDANTAVYLKNAPAEITQAGGLSPYGTMAQGGNVWEWEETDFDLINDTNSSIVMFDYEFEPARGWRGGHWGAASESLDASSRGAGGWPCIDFCIWTPTGFRVASVPEPSSLLLGILAAVGLLVRKRRSTH